MQRDQNNTAEKVWAFITLRKDEKYVQFSMKILMEVTIFRNLGLGRRIIINNSLKKCGMVVQDTDHRPAP
jgi:hypothetical protein